MNKVITWCKKNDYHILGARLTESEHLTAQRLILPDGTIDTVVLEIISTENLLAGWSHADFLQAYLGVYKGKWIGFVSQNGETIMKLQATTLPDLQKKIINKIKPNDSSTLPRE